MATGDKAAAAGLHTAPDTQAVNRGANNHNLRGDELATEIETRANADNGLWFAVNAATDAIATKVDNSRIRIQGNQPETIAGVSGRIWFQPV